MSQLQLYRQLVFEFGWEVMREVFASYYSPEFSRGAHGSFMDGFAIRMSVITQRDLADFFEHWEYPMSSSAAAAPLSSCLFLFFPPEPVTSWSCSIVDVRLIQKAPAEFERRMPPPAFDADVLPAAGMVPPRRT